MDKNNNDDENNCDFLFFGWLGYIYDKSINSVPNNADKISLNAPMRRFSARLSMLLIM
jgi:hypothetical protein